MVALEPVQIILIVALVVIFPLGLWNQKRQVKKKESMLQSYTYSPNMDSANLSDNEKKAKEYIIQYKATYQKDSIKAGLINMGLSDSESESYLSKYFN